MSRGYFLWCSIFVAIKFTRVQVIQSFKSEGNFPCEELFTEISVTNDVITPRRCSLFNYTTYSNQISNCFQPAHPKPIVFVGDSRIRQQFYYMYGLLSGDFDPFNRQYEAKVISKNLTVDNLGVTLEFYWKPYLDKNLTDVYRQLLNRPDKQQPGFIVTGVATWELREHNWGDDMDSFTRDYTDTLLATVPLFEKLSTSTDVIWQLQDPVHPQLAALHKKKWTNDMLETANSLAVKTLQKTSVIIWKSSRTIAWHFRNDSYDGFHIGSSALFWENQILLNFYCNKLISDNSRSYCCMSRGSKVHDLLAYDGRLQLNTLVFYIFAICILTWVSLYYMMRSRRRHVLTCDACTLPSL